MGAFEPYLHTAEQVVRKAGELILSPEAGVLRDTQHYKGRYDIVTQADVEVEDLVVHELLAAHPETGAVGEERGERGSGEAMQASAGEDPGALRWIVDPIDGTLNFARRNPWYAVSVALVQGTSPVVGVVFSPEMDLLYAAERDHGAQLNGEAIQPSSVDKLDQAVLAIGHQVRAASDGDGAVWNGLGGLIREAMDLRRLGAASLDICEVARGGLDAFWEWPVQPWDVAAAAVILREAGGRVTDLRGNPYRASDREILASNGPLHHLLTRRLSGEQGPAA